MPFIKVKHCCPGESAWPLFVEERWCTSAKRAKEAKTKSGNLTPRQKGVGMVQVHPCDTTSTNSKNARPMIIVIANQHLTQVELQVEDQLWSESLHVWDLLQLHRPLQCLRILCANG